MNVQLKFVLFFQQSLYEEVGVHVGGFLGSQSPVGGFKNVDVAVCTIEKGNNLVNRLIEENELNQLGMNQRKFFF